MANSSTTSVKHVVKAGVGEWMIKGGIDNTTIPGGQVEVQEGVFVTEFDYVYDL